LILDEVFGSQDAQRRLAITNALRNLRPTYPQVFLISHVGGLEDEADVVIELERTNTEDGAAGVEMSLS
jgi:DNA repair exonuclease SbcCD ATPase subunit